MSKEIETFEPGEVALAPLKARLDKMPWIDNEEAAMRLALQAFNSDKGEIFEDMGSRSITNLGLAGKTVTISAVAFAESTYRENPKACPYYAVCEATTTDGEMLSFAVGGWGPVTRLMRATEVGEFPVTVRIAEIPSKVPGHRAAFSLVYA